MLYVLKSKVYYVVRIRAKPFKYLNLSKKTIEKNIRKVFHSLHKL